MIQTWCRQLGSPVGILVLTISWKLHFRESEFLFNPGKLSLWASQTVSQSVEASEQCPQWPQPNSLAHGWWIYSPSSWAWWSAAWMMMCTVGNYFWLSAMRRSRGAGRGNCWRGCVVTSLAGGAVPWFLWEETKITSYRNFFTKNLRRNDSENKTQGITFDPDFGIKIWINNNLKW